MIQDNTVSEIKWDKHYIELKGVRSDWYLYLPSVFTFTGFNEITTGLDEFIIESRDP